MLIANAAVSQVLATLEPKLCDGAMLQQLDWALGLLSKEAADLRIRVEPDYQPQLIWRARNERKTSSFDSKA